MKMRWSKETADAASHAGWSVVETDGVDDYEGWGVHLLRRCADAASEVVARDAELEGKAALAAKIRADGGEKWAVIAWSYGSCSYCDPYENACPYNATPEQAFTVFGDLIEECVDVDAARMKFSERKGW